MRTTGGGQNQPAPLAASTDCVRELSRGDRTAYSRMHLLDHAYNCMIPQITYFVDSNDRIVLLILIIERCFSERNSICIVSIPPGSRSW
jgi:hypothetical protein